jgi:hypothetical protein
MLAALITILILVGSSGLLFDYGDLKKAVKTHVVEKEHKDVALDIVKEFKQRAKSQGKQLKATAREVDDALSAYAPGDDQLAALGSQYISDTRSYYKDLLDLRFKLKDQLTREEWTAVFTSEELHE